MKMFSVVWSTLAALLLWAARVDAGVMLWQVTGIGMEEPAALYAMAGRLARKEVAAVTAGGVWSGWGVPGSAVYVMRREIWLHLGEWLAARGRVVPGETAVPGYRDLISSGYISVNMIGMPECMGNSGK